MRRRVGEGEAETAAEGEASEQLRVGCRLHGRGRAGGLGGCCATDKAARGAEDQATDGGRGMPL